MSRDSVLLSRLFLYMMRHKWEESAVWFIRFWEHQSCTGCLACIFFHAQPGRGRALSAVQCLGLDLHASLVMALGLWYVTLSQRLVVSPLLTAQWLGGILLLLPMAYPGFPAQDYAIPRLLGLFAGLLFLANLYQWRFDREAQTGCSIVSIHRNSIDTGKMRRSSNLIPLSCLPDPAPWIRSP